MSSPTDLALEEAKQEALRRAEAERRPIGVYQTRERRWKLIASGESVPAGYRLLTTFRPKETGINWERELSTLQRTVQARPDIDDRDGYALLVLSLLRQALATGTERQLAQQAMRYQTRAREADRNGEPMLL